VILADRDYALFKKAAWEHRNNPNAKDGIHFKCFNRKEATLYKAAMQQLHPKIPVFVSWMEFTEPVEEK